VPDLQARLNRDVVAKQPTIVVIYIGINDVWHGEIDPAKGTSPEVFKAGLEEVVDRCTAAGARVIVCTPSVIGEKKGNANHLDEKLDHYADISREICKRKKLQLCDLRKAFVEYLAKHNPDNEDRGILTTDGVHLNDAGNRFVADTLLPHLGKQR
jgi:lysophospholipase L1-like esterase